jgi:short-subunit dehydrogenase
LWSKNSNGLKWRGLGFYTCSLFEWASPTQKQRLQSRFQEVIDYRRIPARKGRETAEKVAHVGLQALAAGKSYVISGTGNYLGAHAQRLVPRRFVTRITAKMFRPRNTKPS